MNTRRIHNTILGATALVAFLVGAVLFSPAAGAKKRKGGALNATKRVDAAIPDRGPGADTPYGLLTSTIEVGKRFRGKQIRDVNVTVQTTGLTGASPGNDLEAQVTAPNGATSILFFSLNPPLPQPSISIGPLTLDDESPLQPSDVFSPPDPTYLPYPWAGSAQPRTSLAGMDNGPVRGTWTLKVTDGSSAGGDASLLNFWAIKVATGGPYLTK